MKYIVPLSLLYSAVAYAGYTTEWTWRNNQFWRENAPPLCNSKAIEDMDVSKCHCNNMPDKCPAIDCRTCEKLVHGGIPAHKKILDCKKGCDYAAIECEGCGLWFHTVCKCVMNPGSCTSSAPVAKGKGPVWLLVEELTDDNLITTTKFLPGIFESIEPKNQDFTNQGWIFAQSHYDHRMEALALNSYRARTQEQFHIHVCEKNKDLEDILTREKVPPSSHFTQLKGNPHIWCMARPKLGLAMTFADSIADFINADHSGVCAQWVGAGIMTDRRGNTWGCATTISSGPLGLFCKPKKPPGSD